jgi:hypothetical protein
MEFKNEIISVNRLFETSVCEIVQSSPQRKWMDETRDKYAYKCMPMTIANQSSWDVLCPYGAEIEWDGGDNLDSIRFAQVDEEPQSFNFISSIFGHGIVTFHVDFVIRTSENNSIYVKGPTNRIKHGIHPLEGIVETFWLPFTFTMNWKFTAPGKVIFDKGEPMFTFFPINLNYIESFSLKTCSIQEDRPFECKYETYKESRLDYIADRCTGWQKFYNQGVLPYDQTKAEKHKNKITLKKIN